MSVQTQTRQVDLPYVNLVPPEIQERRDFRRLQAALVALVILVIAAVGALYWQGRSGVTDAKAKLAADQAQQQHLRRDINKLHDVTQTQQQLAAAQTIEAQVHSTNVQWSQTLSDVSATLPSNVWYKSLNINETVAPASYANSTQLPPAIGSVSFQGVGFVHKLPLGWSVHNAVADWLDAMTKVSYFADPTFSSSNEAAIGLTPVANFTSTVTVTNEAVKGCAKPGVCS